MYKTPIDCELSGFGMITCLWEMIHSVLKAAEQYEMASSWPFTPCRNSRCKRCRIVACELLTRWRSSKANLRKAHEESLRLRHPVFRNSKKDHGQNAEYIC